MENTDKICKKFRKRKQSKRLVLSARMKSMKNKFTKCTTIAEIFNEMNNQCERCIEETAKYEDTSAREKENEDVTEEFVENVDMEEEFLENIEMEEEFLDDTDMEEEFLEDVIDEELIQDTEVDKGRLQKSTIEGRRIVDLQHLFNEMHEKFDNHSHGIDCHFADIIIIGSRRNGLITEIDMQCRTCNYKNTICSEPRDNEIMDINDSAVAGSVITGISCYQLEEMFSAMNIPPMSERKYKQCMKNIYESFYKAAQQQMAIAAEEEKALAIQRGNVIDGTPHIPVVADESWMKRSYRTGKYDSLSGVGAIVGYHTKKILFIAVRNKYCGICEYAAGKKEEAKEHRWFKNWGRNQTSTSMESDAIVEGFKCSIEMHGLVYSTLIADGDSSIYKKLVDSDPYYNVHIRKIECSNHLLRNLAQKLKEIYKMKGRLGKLRNTIETNIVRILNAVTKAAAFRSAEEVPMYKKVQALKTDLRNIPSHVFGEHKNCARLQYFCDGTRKENEENIVPLLQNVGAFQKIEDAINSLSYYAESLLYNVNSNTVESYNAIIRKFIDGKH